MYVYVMDQFDTPFCFFLFDPCCEFLLGGKGGWRVFVIASGWLVGWLVVEGESKRERTMSNK